MTPKLTRAAQLLLCLLTASLGTHAQTKQTSLQKIYAQSGGGAATGQGYSGSLAVQTVWKGDWSATASFHSISMRPGNLPGDYEPGHFFGIPDNYPESVLSIYSIAAGKRLGKGRTTWFTTEAGLSYVKGEEFTFRPQSTEGTFLSSRANYSSTTKSVSGIGVLLKADFTWAFASFAGLGAGVYADINSVQSPVGIELKLVAGWMNREPKK